MLNYNISFKQFFNNKINAEKLVFPPKHLEHSVLADSIFKSKIKDKIIRQLGKNFKATLKTKGKNINEKYSDFLDCSYCEGTIYSHEFEYRGRFGICCEVMWKNCEKSKKIRN